MQIKYISSSPNSPGLLRKALAVVMMVVLAAVALMFSAILLTVLLVVVVFGGAYLWWKTRELRRLMRNFSPREEMRQEKARDEEVFEGEVIRVVGSGKKL